MDEIVGAETLIYISRDEAAEAGATSGGISAAKANKRWRDRAREIYDLIVAKRPCESDRWVLGRLKAHRRAAGNGAGEIMNAMNDPLILEDIREASSALGEVQAFVHVAGYSFGLGFAKIKWLLEKDHWRQSGFDRIEDFAAPIQFDKSGLFNSLYFEGLPPIPKGANV